jgi:hypothetical protein
MADLGPCSACGAPGSGIRLNNRPYCDARADQRLANATGWPSLPAPPPAEVIIGPDHKRHFVRYRTLRMPGGVVALAEELGGPLHAGYRLELLGDHFRSVAAARAHSDRNPCGYRPPVLKVDNYHGLTIAGDVVAGRLEEAEETEEDELDLAEEGPRVIVDGQGMSWAELGEMLKSYVGWSFELRLGGDPPSSDEHGNTLPARHRATTNSRRTARRGASAAFLRMAHSFWTLPITPRRMSGRSATPLTLFEKLDSPLPVCRVLA